MMVFALTPSRPEYLRVSEVVVLPFYVILVLGTNKLLILPNDETLYKSESECDQRRLSSRSP